MRRTAQRGAVAVEVAAVTPLLVFVILAGVHFGNALVLRHRLAAATDTATRSAAIAGAAATAQIRSQIRSEVGSSTACTRLDVRARRVVNLGVASVVVDATCHVDGDRLSTSLTGFLGPAQLAVRVAMPLQES